MEVSSENKELAKYITTIVGINRTVQRYWDDKKENYLDIFTCDDPIYPKIKIYGTIGLSDHPNAVEMKNGEHKNVPIELLMSGYSNFEKIPNILSTCGFYMLKNQWTCQWGSVFMRMVDFYYQKEMQHVVFDSPFLWENKLEPLTLTSKTVHWLHAILISEKELEYRNKNGFNALRDLFEKKEVDIFDVDRKSII